MQPISKFMAALAAFLISGWAITTFADGPENLLLVVNAKSKDSLAIANHYATLRDVPDRNVFLMDSVPEKELIKIDDFRSKILQPILSEIKKRKLDDQISMIIYSSDFPTKIRMPKDCNKFVRPEEYQKYFGITASINSLTYFASQVVREDYTFVGPTPNFYFRLTGEEVLRFNPFVGKAKETFSNLQSAFQSGSFDKALDLAESLLSGNEPRPVVRFRTAQCLANLDRAEEAIEMLEKAIADGWHFKELTQSQKEFEKLKEQKRFADAIGKMRELRRAPVSSFSSDTYWRPNSFPTSNPLEGRKFYLSMVLGVSRGKGNTVNEIVGSLNRSVAADHSNPKGKFYFVSNSKVRAKTRAPLIPEAVDALKSINQTAEVIPTTLPASQSDVTGLMMGAPKFDWNKSGSTILPGAICDNLTSFGGVMDGKPGTGQTTVAEFIKHGAAGASGTVTEPFTIPHKFPHPMIHYYYARGCNLAEAFYQSVHGPYQLLIVGDPLCRPFGKNLEFSIQGLANPDSISGKIDLSIDIGSNELIKSFDLYYDDALVRSSNVDESIEFDSRKAPDGYHEFRVVAKTGGPVVFSRSRKVGVIIRNRGKLPTVKPTNNQLQLNGKLTIKLSEPIPAKLIAKKFGQILDSVPMDKNSTSTDGISLNCSQLGPGPSRIRIYAEKNSTSLCLGTILVNVKDKQP